MLAGYYQCCFSLQRDVVETGFLLDYLGRNPCEISSWRTCDRENRMKLYGPKRIRVALEKADGVNREPIYTDLSEYAAHPTPLTRLVERGGSRLTGPMFDGKALICCLGELARNVPYFAIVVGHALVELTPSLKPHVDGYKVFLRGWARKALKLDLGDFDRRNVAEWARTLWPPRANPNTGKQKS
jgi:hypothetical protein